MPRLLRLAIEGCYPSFSANDLVIRVLGVLCRYELVSRWAPHDLLIRGPFCDGSARRRLANRALTCHKRLLRRDTALRLHVSSENPFATNYQSFEESGCEFGLGHEIRVGDDRYLRLPHWLNYVDFRGQGIPSPDVWIRLGSPLSLEQLAQPLRWNCKGAERAAFVASHLNSERRFLMQRAALALPIDGFGRAFDRSISDHTRSLFTKRELLSGYRYNFCPENAIAPGYVTEKIPESFVCGSIPIGYVDPHVAMDFDPRAFLNLHDYLADGVENGLREALASRSRLHQLIGTPLLRQPVSLEGLIIFLENVLSHARGG